MKEIHLKIVFYCIPENLTKFGSQRDSHMPYICSEHVPLTTKSSVTIGQPIKSMEAMYGACVLGSRPAITGSAKYGPNLEHIRPHEVTTTILYAAHWLTCIYLVNTQPCPNSLASYTITCILNFFSSAYKTTHPACY